VLRAFIEDNPKNLDNLGEMDKFLAGYTPSTELLTACHCEHCSGDPHKEHPEFTHGCRDPSRTNHQGLGK